MHSTQHTKLTKNYRSSIFYRILPYIAVKVAQLSSVVKWG